MRQIIARLLLTLASVILIAGAIVHGSAFPRAATALEASGVAPHFVNAFKMLWMADSSTLLSIGIIFGYIAGRAPHVHRVMILLIALNPLATSILLYHFLGVVQATYLIATAALSGLVASAIYSVPQSIPPKTNGLR